MALKFMTAQLFLKTRALDRHHSRGSVVQGISCSDRNPLTSSIASIKGFWTPGLRLETRSSKSAQTRGTDSLGGLTGGSASPSSVLGVAGGHGLATFDAAPTTLVTASSAYLSCTHACFLNLGSKSAASASAFTCSVPPNCLAISTTRMSTISRTGWWVEGVPCWCTVGLWSPFAIGIAFEPVAKL